MRKILTPGTLLHNQFFIKKILSKTSECIVYLVQDCKIAERLCTAYEFFPKTFSKAEKTFLKETFLSQIHRLQELKHSNLLAVLDGFQEGNRFYCITEYREDLSLQAIADLTKEPFPEKQVLEWAVQLCEALQFLHEQPSPFFCKEIHPRYILVDRDGHVKLGGYGLPLLFVPAGKDSLFLPAPEVRETLVGSVPGDLYSLGACLYFLLTRKEPDLPPEPMESPVSPAAEKLIQLCLQENPVDRPSSALELQNQINKILHPIPEITPQKRKPVWQKVLKTVKKTIGYRTAKTFQILFSLFNTPYTLLLTLAFLFLIFYPGKKKKATYLKSGPLFYVFSRQGITLLDGKSFQAVYHVKRTSPGKYVIYRPEADKIEMVSSQGLFSALDINHTTVSDKFFLKKIIGGVAVGPKRVLLTTLYQENLLETFSLDTGVPLAAIPLPRSPGDVVYNPAGREIYVAGEDPPSITVIEARKYLIKQAFPLNFPPDHLVLSQEGNLLFISYKSFPEIDVLDTARKKIVEQLFQEGMPPYSLQTSPNGLLVTDTRGNEVSLYDANFKKQTFPINRPTCAIADPAGNYIAVGSRRGYFWVIQIPSGKIEHRSRVYEEPYSILYVP